MSESWPTIRPIHSTPTAKRRRCAQTVFRHAGILVCAPFYVGAGFVPQQLAKLLLLPPVLALLPVRQSDLKMTMPPSKLSLYRAPTRALLFLSKTMVSTSLHHNWILPTTQASLNLYSAAGTTIPIEEILFVPDTHEDPSGFVEEHDIDELASQLDITHHATELSTLLGCWDTQEVPFW
jgi:hypothetical protein